MVALILLLSSDFQTESLQKFTADELRTMNSMGLISAKMLTSDVKVFTNDTTGL
jgi:hypothetical protein